MDTVAPLLIPVIASALNHAIGVAAWERLATNDSQQTPEQILHDRRASRLLPLGRWRASVHARSGRENALRNSVRKSRRGVFKQAVGSRDSPSVPGGSAFATCADYKAPLDKVSCGIKWPQSSSPRFAWVLGTINARSGAASCPTAVTECRRRCLVRPLFDDSELQWYCGLPGVQPRPLSKSQLRRNR